MLKKSLEEELVLKHLWKWELTNARLRKLENVNKWKEKKENNKQNK